MYRETNGQFYFVGDPAPFDYDGPRYSYYGAHPVADAEVHFGHPVYCYIKGPHFHWYQPPAQAQFQLSGGAYWYMGNFPRAYYDELRGREKSHCQAVRQLANRRVGILHACLEQHLNYDEEIAWKHRVDLAA